MLNWLKNKINPMETLPEIGRLTVGRAAHLDPLVARLLPEGALLEIPTNTISIVAQGQADMGEQVHLHRFYPDEDSLLLQVLGGDGKTDQSIQEITLYHVLDVYYPSADKDWRAWADRIRQPHFNLPNDGPRYERAWFNNSDKAEEPVSFWETVYDSRQATAGRRIFQTCMLYVRSLGEQDEFLLVNMEEPESGDRCVSLMTGLSLSPNQITV